MISKSELLNYIETKYRSNFKEEELFSELDLDIEESGIFAEMLHSLEVSGELYRDSNGNLFSIKNSEYFIGRYMGNKSSSRYGFIRPSKKFNFEKDFYVAFKNSNSAMNGDRVLFKVRNKRKDEAKVISILERANYTLIGEFHRHKNACYLIPDDTTISSDIYIDVDKTLNAKSGQKIVAKIIKWPNKNNSIKAKVVEILGYPDEYGVDVLSIIRNFKLPDSFPKKVIDSIVDLPMEVEEKDLENRVDHRDDLVITIDGEDAKDLDDAISLIYLNNKNYKLDVHIADVSHYVKENSYLDKEALKRGTSVYLVDKVIPMLPKELSNGICSLNPNVDRLTMTCSMEIDKNGNLVNYKIYKSVICSKYRMNYNDVSDILENVENESLDRYTLLKPMLKLMEELTLILREKRIKRGAIDFNFKESYIITDEKGIAIDVKERDRRIANRIIEEFMLAANQCVALHSYNKKLPFVYRVHKKPDLEKIMIFRRFLFNLGYKLEGTSENVEPKHVQAILNKISGIKEEKMLNKLLLRSLQKAKYSNVLGSHFGLACDYYSHFTSPIRRYPDLQIHRILSESLKNKMSSKRLSQLEAKVAISSELSSEREVIADEAQRDCEKMKKAEYMSKYIGEVYEATISSLVSYGMYVELENTVEGLVHISKFDDYYVFDEEKMLFVSSTNQYSIGDKIEVRLIGVDIEMREIDFDLNDESFDSRNADRVENKRYDEIIKSIEEENKKKKYVQVKSENKKKNNKVRTKERWKKSKKNKKNKIKKGKKKYKNKNNNKKF